MLNLYLCCLFFNFVVIKLCACLFLDLETDRQTDRQRQRQSARERETMRSGIRKKRLNQTSWFLSSKSISQNLMKFESYVFFP